MVYVTGTRVNEPTPAVSLNTAIRNAIAQHTNWAFIESFTDAAGYIHDIYRCNAAGNAVGRDFFVGFMRAPNNTSQNLSVEAFELYDAVAHQYTRPVPVIPSVTITPTSQGTTDETPRLLNAGESGVGRNQPLYSENQITVGPAGGTYDYWILVTANGVMVSTRIGSAFYGQYISILESFVYQPTVNDPCPLVIAPLTASQGSIYGGSGYSSVRASRAPLTGGVARNGAIFGLYPFVVADTAGGITPSWTGIGTRLTSTDTPDLYQNGAPLASRAVAISDALGIYTPNQVGAVRGLWRDMLKLRLGSGATQGDTIVVNGQTYVCTGQSVWFNTQAL